MIWPIMMQLLTHCQTPEMTESLVGKESNCFDSELAEDNFLQKRFCKDIPHRVEIEERKNFLKENFA